MKLAFLAVVMLPFCGCNTISTALKGSSFTLAFTPLSLGPVGVGQVSFTVSPGAARTAK